MSESRVHTVTGATGYTGRYIAAKLLEQGHRIQSITGHPDRPKPFGRQIELRPFDFDQAARLTSPVAIATLSFSTITPCLAPGNPNSSRM